jgi:uncharacterized protein (TIGR02246 family)
MMSNVEQAVARFCDAWNRHDVDDLAAMWSEDGELNHPWGFRAVGREDIRALLAKEHAASMATSQLSVSRITSRHDDRSVLAAIDGVLAGVRAPNGRSYDLRHTISAMFIECPGGWQIRTMTPIANPRQSDDSMQDLCDLPRK